MTSDSNGLLRIMPMRGRADARIDEFAELLPREAGIDLLRFGSIMHGLADHTHVVQMFEFAGGEAGSLSAWFESGADALDGHCAVSDRARWAANRIMASQEVRYRSVAQSVLSTYLPPTLRRHEVGRVFRALAEPGHAEHLMRVIHDQRVLCADGPWPQLTSVGRYFHALADAAEQVARTQLERGEYAYELRRRPSDDAIFEVLTDIPNPVSGDHEILLRNQRTGRKFRATVAGLERKYERI